MTRSSCSPFKSFSVKEERLGLAGTSTVSVCPVPICWVSSCGVGC
jgi:hypothetical protein